MQSYRATEMQKCDLKSSLHLKQLKSMINALNIQTVNEYKIKKHDKSNKFAYNSLVNNCHVKM